MPTVCDFCGKEVEAKEKLKHQWAEHRDEMLKISAKRRKSKSEKSPPEADKTIKPRTAEKTAATGKAKAISAITDNPVQAAILEFVGERLQLPMTPALIYGYFCAKKMGFEGTVAEFLAEVIDDFFESREINYYAEVMKWKTGETIIPEELMITATTEKALQTSISER